MMIEKWVTLNLGSDYEVRVMVKCMPDITEEELIKKANSKVFNRMDMEV